MSDSNETKIQVEKYIDSLIDDDLFADIPKATGSELKGENVEIRTDVLAESSQIKIDSQNTQSNDVFNISLLVSEIPDSAVVVDNKDTFREITPNEIAPKEIATINYADEENVAVCDVPGDIAIEDSEEEVAVTYKNRLLFETLDNTVNSPSNIRDKFKDDVQLLVFELNKDFYCVDLSRIKEICPYQELTSSHNKSKYVAGNLMLRDEVIPVVDMNYLLDGEFTDLSKFTSIIIVEKITDDMVVQYGFIANYVKNIFDIQREGIKNLSQSNVGRSHGLCNYIVDIEGKLYVILDVEQLFDV